MSKSFLPMMCTVVGAVGTYYLFAVKWGLGNNIGTVAGIIAAVVLSAAFTRLKRN